MWHSTTLKGLDDALIDLQRAIDKLPDGSKKRQLEKRFQRLQQVRFELNNPGGVQPTDYTMIWTGMILVLVVTILYLVWIKPVLRRIFISKH